MVTDLAMPDSGSDSEYEGEDTSTKELKHRLAGKKNPALLFI